MTPIPEIALVTSIPPRMTREQQGRNIGEQYQADCVASWITAGFKVLSVNVRAEIPLLARRFPAVEFVPVDRDAAAVAGRPTPLIDDLLQVLAQQPQDIVGIINADLCMETGKDWMAPIKTSVASTVLIGHRLDLIHWSTEPGELVATGAPYDGGFDLFFFEKSAIAKCLTGAGAQRFFSLGMPWWDFWLPIALALQGYRIALMAGPLAGHLVHPIKYDPAIWEYMGAQFIDYVRQHMRDDIAAQVPELAPMIERVRLLGPRAAQEIRTWQRQRALADRGDKWSARYRTNIELFCGLTLVTLRDQIGCGTQCSAVAD
ncbi:MAG: hypothetical protein QOJ54_2707 [Aliidongia sp.]|jgi:hypothetical protein|nr:hypothetical protein [Aliidongia sp.]